MISEFVLIFIYLDIELQCAVLEESNLFKDLCGNFFMWSWDTLYPHS